MVVVVGYSTSSIIGGHIIGGSHKMLVEFCPSFLSQYFSYALGLMPFSSRAFWILVCMSAMVAEVIGIISMVVLFL